VTAQRFFVHALSVTAVVLTVLAASPRPPFQAFQASQGPVPVAVAERMRGHSWHDGCPTTIAELSYLRLPYFGFDGAVHQGELVVHREVAAEVIPIFEALFEQHFPIEKMRLIDDYAGDDDASMADNNTSAFNCRFVPGKPGVFSKHSSGHAVDVNPRINPMMVGTAVFPPSAAAFVDRRMTAPGLIHPGDPTVRAFLRHGWTWGGDWQSMKDYQHFEK
jgi:D-alanyl-D-alanine carboxypeptidase